MAKRWGYGCNNLYKTCSVHLESGPWWAFILPGAVNWICEHIPEWRIPFLGHRKVVDEDGEVHPFWDWHGNIQQMFCAHVDMPIATWVYNEKIQCISVPLSWEEGRKRFYDQDPARWDEWESDPEFGVYEGKTTEEVTHLLMAEDDLPSDEWIDANISEVCSEVEKA